MGFAMHTSERRLPNSSRIRQTCQIVRMPMHRSAKWMLGNLGTPSNWAWHECFSLITEIGLGNPKADKSVMHQNNIRLEHTLTIASSTCRCFPPFPEQEYLVKGMPFLIVRGSPWGSSLAENRPLAKHHVCSLCTLGLMLLPHKLVYLSTWIYHQEKRAGDSHKVEAATSGEDGGSTLLSFSS